jgi:hypothetical protein
MVMQDTSTTAVSIWSSAEMGHLLILFKDDSLYSTYLPFPLAVLARPDALDVQNVYIVPEASTVATAEFGGDAVAKWQAALGRNLTDVGSTSQPPGLNSLSSSSTVLASFLSMTRTLGQSLTRTRQ